MADQNSNSNERSALNMGDKKNESGIASSSNNNTNVTGDNSKNLGGDRDKQTDTTSSVGTAGAERDSRMANKTAETTGERR